MIEKCFFFIITLVIGCIHPALAQKLDLRFEHIGSSNGLSHGSVTCIVQDYEGFMWFGTIDGLNRYDGYRIKVYRYNPLDSLSLSSSDITSLYEDSEMNLWVGTTQGINRYDRESNRFIRYPETKGRVIHNLIEDRNHDIWITADRHVFQLSKVDQQFFSVAPANLMSHIEDFYQDNQDTIWIALDNGVYNYSKILAGNQTGLEVRLEKPHRLIEDRVGNFWIATFEEGLILYDRETRQIKRQFLNEINNPNSLVGNSIKSLNVDKENRVWIGAQNQGLSVYDLKKNEFHNYKSNSLDPNSLSFNTINTIYVDRTNNMWLGTHNKGVNFVRQREFSHYYASSLDHQGLSDNNVTSFVEDKDGNIWIGTDGGGLNIFDRKSDKFKVLKHEADNPKSLSSNVITYVLEDKQKNIWIAYWEGGIDKIGPSGKLEARYRHDSEDSASLRRDDIMYLFEDKKENLWVATLTGLDLLNKENGTFKHINLGGGLKDYVTSMEEDSQGRLWVGTWEGLFLLDRESYQFQHFIHNPEDNQTLSENKVYSVFEDSRNRLWVGTVRGLNLLDTSSLMFKQFHVEDGLPSNAVYGILEDGRGDLWLSTGNGLSRFNPQEEVFKCFGVSDGLQDKEFKLHAFLKLRSGEMVFGGGNGFNIFNPQSIRDNTIVPPVVLTDFKVFYKSLVPGGPDSLLSRSLTLTKKIVLTHEQSVFSIEFAALNYVSPHENQYAYILEGFDQNWAFAGSKRTATYTNLDPGAYTFKVKASNNDGYWNENGVSLAIVITPPFWETSLFQFFVALFVVGIIFSLIQLRTYNIRKKRKELEHKVKEQTKELIIARNEAIAASKSKSEFLANMSHEIRTPMNGIIGMAELAVEDTSDEKQKDYLRTIINSSDSLVAIINDILDYSKIEAGKLSLDETRFNIDELMDSLMASLSVKALKKEVEVLYEVKSDIPTFVKTDPLRLRQVITNLVDNAIKFTAKGEVLVSVERAEMGHLESEVPLHFKVKDTGIGIPPEKLKLIFESFSQADTSTTRQYGGTGLGLAISLRLVDMMGGRIWVESEVGVGSTFHFTIRCGKTEETERYPAKFNNWDSIKGRNFLVVDDNITNCIMLHDLLANQGAQVAVANNGYDGLKKVAEIPDAIILLDQQMPEMDGLEFVMKLRERGNISSKVILLSSMADMTKSEANHAGIDGYLTKPVRKKELWKVIGDVLGESLDKTEVAEVSNSNSEESKVISTKKILLAEDNETNQLVAGLLFSKFGIQHDLAVDGKSASEMLRSKVYDLVFMDIQMPFMDGYQVTRELRKSKDHLNHKVPIVAMTAYAMKGDREKCMEAGMNDYISKPIKINDLREKILKWGILDENGVSKVYEK